MCIWSRYSSRLECKSVCLPLCVCACANRQDLSARASVRTCVVTAGFPGSMNDAVGVCSCLQQGTAKQSCCRRDLGLLVVPDALQLCSCALCCCQRGLPQAVIYKWNYLAAAPCVLLSMSNAYCYQVSRWVATAAHASCLFYCCSIMCSFVFGLFPALVLVFVIRIKSCASCPCI